MLWKALRRGGEGRGAGRWKAATQSMTRAPAMSSEAAAPHDAQSVVRTEGTAAGEWADRTQRVTAAAEARRGEGRGKGCGTGRSSEGMNGAAAGAAVVADVEAAVAEAEAVVAGGRACASAQGRRRQRERGWSRAAATASATEEWATNQRAQRMAPLIGAAPSGLGQDRPSNRSVHQTHSEHSKMATAKAKEDNTKLKAGGLGGERFILEFS